MIEYVVRLDCLPGDPLSPPRGLQKDMEVIAIGGERVLRKPLFDLEVIQIALERCVDRALLFLH